MNNTETFTRLCGAEETADMVKAPALPPFDARAIAFLSDLSAALLKNPSAKAWPDVITFAFFCRKAHLLRLRQEYEDALPNRIGRGLTFHVAPSNVPINFAYSLAAALLAGNSCLVKASSQDFAQTRIVCAAMDTLLSETHCSLRPYVNVVTYPREAQALTEEFCALCDVRVIWGGDETVRRVREAPLSPMAFDVTFADRYSLLCVQPEAVLAMSEQELTAMAEGFYNDTFLSDQNACTAPRLVYWVGSADTSNPLRLAQKRFWDAILAYAATRYPVEPVVAVDKLTALYRAAITLPGAKRASTNAECGMRDSEFGYQGPDNLITRISVDALDEALLDFRCAGGCFVEYTAPTLDALASIAGRKVQTISYLGLNPEEIWQLVRERGLRGVDRIVPIGKTMDFSLVWDGYDLILTLSRCVTKS